MPDNVEKYIGTFCYTESKTFKGKAYYFDFMPHNPFGNRAIEVVDIYSGGSVAVNIRGEYVDDRTIAKRNPITAEKLPEDIKIKFIEYLFSEEFIKRMGSW